ncbi:MAG: aspartate carbamoyltransferase catalytic subunit, partial [Myxococcales bacterium]|nr:aspartate carbamoyltransferase catalytic subunit [Myxococcales bacterium]
MIEVNTGDDPKIRATPLRAASVAAAARVPGQDLLDIVSLADDELLALLSAAARCSAIVDGPPPRGSDALRGFTVVNLFNEPSTRTRISFELAARRLGADVINFTGDQSSSAAKGETPLDTALTLDAMGVDALVVRDRFERFPHEVARHVRARVINAGDGRNEHPTQALLDALTIVEAFGRPLEAGASALAGLTVAICGDVRHGRVAHSNMLLLRRLGATIRVAGPDGLVEPGTDARYGVEVVDSLDAAIAGAHVVMMLRIQRERLGRELALPSRREYFARWGLSMKRLELADPRVIVMHPGPM